MKDQQPNAAVADAVARHHAQALTRATFLRRSMAGVVGVTTLSSVLAACGSSGSSKPSTAGDAVSGLKPDIAVRYDPTAKAGAKPSGLPRSFAYVAFSGDPFWASLSAAMKQGADATGLSFGDANAQADPAKFLDLIQQQLTRGVGGTSFSPVDPKSEASLAQQAIDQGAYVISDAMAPGITQIGENSAAYGRAIGAAAAKYINTRLGGKADILLLNEGNSIAFLKQRWDGVRSALKQQAPGARVVKDLTSRNTADDGYKQGAAAFAANPGIKVMLGPALGTLGAFAALEANGTATPDMYIASVGGTPDELKAIRQPNSAYKATWAEPWLLIGYLSSYWTARWLDGNAVPMGVELPASVVTIDNIDKYEADMSNPGKVVSENRVDEYVGLWGTINYETRDAHLTQQWYGPRA